ncbi:MAG: BrnA antitoxin family protein [Nitrospiraceae bacterium]|nr:BrnA antitoxin family protein [Nitrospiraceae bacterium]
MKKPLIDKNGEVRELTKEDFKRMHPASEVVPEIVKAYKEGRLKVRGPQKTPTKVQTTLRLSRDVVEFFKATGRGWQTKMDKALKEYVRTHSR